jgi:hypothetical protein
MMQTAVCPRRGSSVSRETVTEDVLTLLTVWRRAWHAPESGYTGPAAFERALAGELPVFGPLRLAPGAQPVRVFACPVRTYLQGFVV